MVRLWLLGSLLLPLRWALALDVYTIDLNSSKSHYARRHIQSLLTAALEASRAQYGPYELRVSPIHMERDRLLEQMRSGTLVNLSAQVTSAEWERALIPIRIPVDKGLAGYRVALIDSRQQALFSQVRTLDQLKAIPLGAGSQWSTTAVLRQAGFRVVQANSTVGLYSMLAAGRFLQFPRSLDEALYEQVVYAPGFPTLVLERDLVVYFPLPRYFFLARGQERLAQRLSYGLGRLLDDGRFDRLFHEYYDNVITQVGLRRRRVFSIPNPYLTPETPLANKALWYDPLAHEK
jgi:hypothetical protein